MDRYQALPDLPFPVVIEALGYPLSEFQTEKVWNRVGGQMPRPQTEEELHGLQSYNVDKRVRLLLLCGQRSREP
jgi:hypothetical protein